MLIALLQNAQPSAFLSLTMPMIVVMAIFYFIVLRPESKRRRELQASIAALKKGDKVITQGGIHGEVAGVEPTAVILKVADGVKIKVTKAGIAGMAEAPSGGNSK
jgi:preprotein translocase subunit YajC